MIQLVHDASGEGEQAVAVDRHTNLLTAISEAVEDAIKANDAAEAAQGFGPITKKELTEVVGNVVSSALAERGITKNQFLAVLNDTPWVLG